MRFLVNLHGSFIALDGRPLGSFMCSPDVIECVRARYDISSPSAMRLSNIDNNFSAEVKWSSDEENTDGSFFEAVETGTSSALYWVYYSLLKTSLLLNKRMQSLIENISLRNPYPHQICLLKMFLLTFCHAEDDLYVAHQFQSNTQHTNTCLSNHRKP